MAEQPQVPRFEIPQIPDDEYIDAQFNFTGQWLPSLDGALIGPENFQTLENMRYNDLSIEGVSGYENWVGDVDQGITTYTLVKDGFQFRSDKSGTQSYNLVRVEDTSGNGRVYFFTGDVGSNYADTGPGSKAVSSGLGFSDHSTYYYADPTANSEGRFAGAPQNSMVYCNGDANLIFSGYKHRYSAAFGAMDTKGTNIIDLTDTVNYENADKTFVLWGNPIPDWDCDDNDGGAVVNYAAVGGASLTKETSIIYDDESAATPRSLEVVTGGAANDGVATNAFEGYAGSVTVTYWIYPTVQTAFTTTITKGGGGPAAAPFSETLIAGQWNKVTHTYTDTDGAAALIQITQDAAAADTFYVDNISYVPEGAVTHLILMTNRQQMAATFDVGSANSVVGTLAVKEWRGSSGWAALTEDADTTDDVTGASLEQDGYYQWQYTDATAKFKHFQDLYLYAYCMTFGTAEMEATINSMWSYSGFNEIPNVWDGVYRQPIEAQVWYNDSSIYQDYTLYVNQSSVSDTFVAMDLTDLDSDDHMIFMFEEPLAGCKISMLQSKINVEASTQTWYYWNGIEWKTLSSEDGTATDDGTVAFAKTGLVKWTPPTDEQPQTLFGSFGYAYKVVLTGTIDGSEADGDRAGNANMEHVGIDFMSGIPALESIPAFEFGVPFQDRLMLGCAADIGEFNRMDLSLTSTPDVWNGTDTSMGGLQSLYYGGAEKLTGAIQLFNRFGSSLYSMLMVFKNREVYMLVGSTPDSYEIYTVSPTIGCPAPGTIATAEVGLELGQGITRNICLWVSHSGPMLFDGAVLTPIRGMETYFDPNSDNYVNWDAMVNARGWVDMGYKEYNLLIPTGGNTDPDVWIVYDLVRKKWFRKKPEEMPSVGWDVMDTQGEQYSFGGITRAKSGTSYGVVHRLDKGTSWDGTAITQRTKSGDFFPTKNIWDEIILRKFTAYVKKLEETSVTMKVYVYTNTQEESGSGIVWVDGAVSNGGDVIWTDGATANGGDVIWAGAIAANLNLSVDTGNQRILKVVKDFNRTGWGLAFQMEVESASTNKGFKPITWGIRYRIERKGDKATD